MTDSEILARKLQALDRLYDETASILNKYDAKPTDASQASIEIQTPLNVPSGLFLSSGINLSNAFLEANILIESAADHLTAFRRTLIEPVLPISLWTCLRAILEASAIACWLIDPKINVSERIARSFARRYENLTQQKAIANSVGDTAGVGEAKNRLGEIEGESLTFGYPPIRDKNKKRIGIGRPMPTFTELVKDVLDQEIIYRISSAIIHGNQSVIMQLSFQKNNEGPVQQFKDVTLHMYEKNLSLSMLRGVCAVVALGFAKANWFRCVMYGWDQSEMGMVLGNAADVLEIPASGSFGLRPTKKVLYNAFSKI